MNAQPLMRALLAIGCLAWLVGGLRSWGQPAPSQSLVESNAAFALDLYAQLKSTPGNLFFSPYSISTSLGMAYSGARANTKKQIRQVLHFAEDPAQVAAGFGALQRQLAEAGNLPGMELKVASGVW